MRRSKRELKHTFAYVATLSLCIIICLSWKTIAADNMTILYSGNMQSQIRPCGGCPGEEELGGLARRATYLKSIGNEASDSILIEAGDVLGELRENEKKAEVIFKSMSQMLYDVVNLGEMDFSSGRIVLEHQIQNPNLPVISANILDKDTGRLFAPQPYIVKIIPNGLRIGIIGILSDKFPIHLLPGEKELRVVSPAEALRQYLPEIQEKSDIVIVLSHLGIFDSTSLARSVDGIDVIISGHGGHGIEKPIVVDGTIIVQTRDKGTHLGRLDLTLDENGKIVSYKNQLIPLGQQYKDDPAILSILDEYKEPVVARWDLGDVKEGETYEEIIEIKNTHQAPLVVHKARPSCDCLTAEVVKKMAMPGESATIRAKLVVEGLKREFEKYIYIQSNNAEKPVTAIAVSGKIVGTMKSETEEGNTEKPKAEDEKPGKQGQPPPKKEAQNIHEAPAKIHPADTSSAPPDKAGPLRATLFYFPGCRGCYEVKDQLLPRIKEKYGEKVKIEKYDTSKMSNYELLMKFEERYGVRENSPMTLFVGDRYFAGSADIEKHLEEAIVEILAAGDQIISSPPVGAEEDNGASEAKISPKLIERFKSFRLVAVLGAGLIDGINPCAFATIIFFISALTLKKRDKKDLLIVGIFFSLSVFIAYLLLGIGVFRVFQRLRAYVVLARFLYWGIIAGVFILGVYSLYDCFIYMKTKKAENIKLQLPRRIKKRMHLAMSRDFRAQARTRGLIVASVVTGFSVSILESICTGQVYLPTIAFIIHEQSLRAKAYSYLVLYNLMFIVPLVIVFLLAYKGVGWERFAEFSRKNVSLSKLLLAGLFFGMGVALLVTG